MRVLALPPIEIPDAVAVRSSPDAGSRGSSASRSTTTLPTLTSRGISAPAERGARRSPAGGRGGSHVSRWRPRRRGRRRVRRWRLRWRRPSRRSCRCPLRRPLPRAPPPSPARRHGRAGRTRRDGLLRLQAGAHQVEEGASPSSPAASRPSPTAHSIRDATSAPAIQVPRAAPRRAASTPRAIASSRPAPSRPALTAAATAEAPAMAMPVSCETRPAARTASTRPGRSVEGQAIPTGVTRIAAPFVVPARPASSAGTPSSTAATAARVDGPSRSSEPRARMSSSHEARRRAKSSASMTPAPSMIAPASRSACSVSSVTDPAGMPAAIGWSAAASRNPSMVPKRSAIAARDISCVGIPRASPMARPCRAASARSRRSSPAALTSATPAPRRRW